MEKEKDNLYLVSMYNRYSERIIKFGYSGRLKERLKHYESHNPFVELLATYYSPDAKAIEKEVHASIKSCYLNEWYREEDYERIIDILEKYGIKETHNFHFMFDSTDLLYNGDGITLDFIRSLTHKENYLLHQLGHCIDRKTNIIPVLGSKLCYDVIATNLETNRKTLKPMIDKFISLNIIKYYNYLWYMNPNFFHRSRTLGIEIWGLFGLTVPPAEKY